MKKYSEETRIALIQQSLNDIQSQVQKIDIQLERSYITRQEVAAKFELFDERYRLVKRLVFTAAGTILSVFFLALVYIIINRHG